MSLPHRSPRRPRRPLHLVLAAALAACAQPAPRPDGDPIAPGARGPRTETIPGSDVRFTLVPLPGTALWIGAHEVTWDEYDLYAFRLDEPGAAPSAADVVTRPSKPYGAPDRGFGHQGYPALSMSGHAAAEYCRWLSLKLGRTFRLPTVAEWQRACSAGGAPGPLDQVAWFADNSDLRTHPVGQKQPSAAGLYDLLGNAGEWASTTDAGGGVAHVLCGGSFRHEAADVTCGATLRPTPAWQQADAHTPKSRWWYSDCAFCGFRVVCEGAPP